MLNYMSHFSLCTVEDNGAWGEDKAGEVTGPTSVCIGLFAPPHAAHHTFRCLVSLRFAFGATVQCCSQHLSENQTGL